MPLSLVALLRQLVDDGGTSLHLTSEAPPTIRVAGELRSMDGLPLSPEEVKALVHSVLTDAQKDRLGREMQLSFAFGLEGLARFRAEFFVQRGAVTATFTQIPVSLPDVEHMGLPEAVLRLTELTSGLVLIAGGTGSGKSTTLAALVDYINRNRAVHILTIEHPIEHLLSHQRARVSQRDVFLDVPSLSEACRSALRADADVVAIGEVRDQEAALWALRLAEEGLLVFTTIFAGSAVQALNHLIDHLPASQQPHALFQLGAALRGVVCQSLVRRPGEDRRAVAAEVLLPDAEMRRLIRDDDLPGVESRFQRGYGAPGSQTLNEVLAGMVGGRLVGRDAALAASQDPADLERRLRPRSSVRSIGARLRRPGSIWRPRGSA